MAHLYELTAQYKEIEEMINNGEISPEDVVDTLDGLDGTFEDKAENIIKLTKELDLISKGIDGEVKRLQARKKSMANKKDRLREYLSNNMQAANKEKIKSDLFTISLAKPRESLVIDDQSLIPTDYIESSEIKYTFDKKALLAAAKEGDVDGVHVEVGKPVLTVR